MTRALQLLLCAALAARTPGAMRSDPSPAVPSAIQITDQQARWTSLTGVDDLGTDQPPYFLISGTIRNNSDRAVRYVKLQYELLDDAGAVLASEYGYNRRAEDL